MKHVGEIEAAARRILEAWPPMEHEIALCLAKAALEPVLEQMGHHPQSEILLQSANLEELEKAIVDQLDERIYQKMFRQTPESEHWHTALRRATRIVQEEFSKARMSLATQLAKPSEALEGERAAFEAWAKTEGYETENDSEGRYIYLGTERAFRLWQAARAALPPVQEGGVDEALAAIQNAYREGYIYGVDDHPVIVERRAWDKVREALRPYLRTTAPAQALPVGEEKDIARWEGFIDGVSAIINLRPPANTSHDGANTLNEIREWGMKFITNAEAQLATLSQSTTTEGK